METQSILPCYYPTHVILIDDKKDFLSSMQLKLPDRLYYTMFNSSTAALNFFKNNLQPNLYIDRCISKDEDARIEEHIIKLDIATIHKEVYSKERFKQISTVVVDYSIPDMNGLEFCTRLNNNLIYKIMLTGEAGYNLATDAFNKKIIHKFILKNAVNLADDVNESILEMQYSYFNKLADVLFSKVSLKHQKESLAFLYDNKFIELFNNICYKYDIVEYYLVDGQGSYLLISYDGTPVLLAVKSEEDIESYLYLAETAHAPKEVITALKNRVAIPVFQTEDDYEASPDKWEKYLYPATLLNNDNNERKLYYALLPKDKITLVDPHRIYAYEDFIDNTM